MKKDKEKLDQQFEEFRRKFLAEPGMPAAVYPAKMEPMGSFADDFPDRHHLHRQGYDLVIYLNVRLRPRAKRVICVSSDFEKGTKFIKAHWPDVKPIPEVVSNAPVELYPVPNATEEQMQKLCKDAKLKGWFYDLEYWDRDASKEK